MKVLLELEVDVTKEELNDIDKRRCLESGEEVASPSTMLTFIQSLQGAMSPEIEVSGIEGKVPVFVMNVHLLNAGL